MTLGNCESVTVFSPWSEMNTKQTQMRNVQNFMLANILLGEQGTMSQKSQISTVPFIIWTFLFKGDLLRDSEIMVELIMSIHTNQCNHELRYQRFIAGQWLRIVVRTLLLC